MILQRFARPLAAATLALGTLCAVPALAQNQIVTLSSFDGSITLRGELVEFDGQNYRLSTALGEISVDAFQVTCEGAGCPARVLSSEFSIVGSSTLGAELVPALVEAYAFALDADLTETMSSADGSTTLVMQDLEGREMANITVNSLGSSAGFAALLNEQAQIAMSSRPVRQREIDVFASRGLGQLNSSAQEHVVGLDGLISIVSRSNPVEAISIENIAAIFAGRITNWAQVGGPDAPINVYVRDRDSGTRQVFEQLVLEPFGFTTSPRATAFDENAALSDAVASDPFGIGFTSYSFERNARAIGIQEVCGIITQPSPFAIKAEEYPLARRLYLYTADGTLAPHAANLIDFIDSDEAQDVISASGYIDQAISVARVDDQGLRLANALFSAQDTAELLQLRDLAGSLVNSERLSTSFRFQPGSSILDVRAQRDAVRLAEYLSRGGFENKDILVMGFTDSIGRSDLNQALSFRRAQQVLTEIQAAAPIGALAGINFEVQGYGEISPLGCNETFNGRRINRRVEVWVRDRV